MSSTKENAGPPREQCNNGDSESEQSVMDFSETLDIIKQLEATEPPEDSTELADFHCQLGNSYLACFAMTDDVQYIRKALHHLNTAMEVTSKNGSNDSASNESASAHSEMLNMTGQAAEQIEDSLERADGLYQVGSAYLSHFEETGDVQYLRQALHHLNVVLELLLPSRPRHPNNTLTPYDITPLLNQIKKMDCKLQVGSTSRGSIGHGNVDMVQLLADPGNASSIETLIESTDDPSESIEMRKGFITIHWHNFKRTGDVQHLHEAIYHMNIVIVIEDTSTRDFKTQAFFGDLLTARFEQVRDISDLHQSVHHRNLAVELAPESYPNKPSLHSNLGTSFRTRFEQVGDIDDLHQSIHHYNRAVELTPEGHPDKPLWHDSLGNSFDLRFEQLEDIHDLHQSIHHYNRAVELTAEDRPNKPLGHANVGFSLLTRFQRLGDIDDLHRSIHHHNRAMELTPEGHPNRLSLHSILVFCFQYRLERLGDINDLNQSLNHLKRAAELSPEDYSAGLLLHTTLGNSFMTRFQRLRDIDDLPQSIHHLNRAVELTPEGDPDKLSLHNNLGSSFITRFELLGDTDDLHHALHHFNCAGELMPDGHPDKPSMHGNLGNAFRTRFQRLGDVHDLVQCIHHLNRAMELTPEGDPGKPALYSNLGNSFLTRFQRLGDADDLLQSINYHNHAVEITPEGHPQKPSLHNNLGNSFLTRFRQLGDIDDLLQSIYHYNCAVDLTPEGHPNKASWHHNLGKSFLTRFEQLGDMDDLVQSIHHHNRAVELTPEGHPDKPLRHNDLGSSFISRFERLGDINDLIQSIHHHNLAVELTPEGRPDKPSHHRSLGISFGTRFERLGDIDDLTQSIHHHNRAVELTPEGHPHKAVRHSNLGNSFGIRFERLGDIKDLVQSIHHHNRAVELTPEDHPEKPLRYSNLGISLITRFEQLGDTDDLHHSLDHFNRAGTLMPDGHPNKPSMHGNLGNSFRTRFERLGDIDDLDQSISQYTRGLDLAPPDHPHSLSISLALSRSLSTRLQVGDLIFALFLCSRATQHVSASPAERFRAAKAWAGFLHQLHGELVPSAYDAYEAAIHELPRISWIGVSVSTRFHELLRTTAIGSDAAAAALCSDKPQISMEWLEQSRSVVWAQILQMRTPMKDLTDAFPALGNRLSHIWSKLDAEDSSVTSEERIELASRSDRLLNEIRAQPGFSRFLLPTEFGELKKAAQSGPIVILNASQYRCDAFILLSSSLRVISLDRCNLLHLRDLQYLFRQAASGSTFRPDRVERAFGPGPSVPTRNEMFRMILDFLWLSVVQPCMETLTQLTSPDASGLIHVRWCPTGPFTFLPIHAATQFDNNGEVLFRLSDTVVSSYIPTISSLLEPRRKVTSAIESKVLAVLQAATPGQSRLFGVDTELKKISQRASEAKIVLKTLYGTQATVDEVLHEIPEYSVVHFSCHGVQDLRDPLKSGLILHDDRLTLSKIMHTKLPNAQLAFLSACETAMGEEDYPDEAVHIAAGMLAAGFRDVIATMWSIYDSAAPTIADLVYAEIFKDGKLVVDRIPFALHHAVEHLRNRNPNDFMAWMPFIHMGP